MLKNEKKANSDCVEKVETLTKKLHLDNATLNKLTAKLKEKKNTK